MSFIVVNAPSKLHRRAGSGCVSLAQSNTNLPAEMSCRSCGIMVDFPPSPTLSDLESHKWVLHGEERYSLGQVRFLLVIVNFQVPLLVPSILVIKRGALDN